MQTFSTKQAARKARVHWVTLLRWAESGKLRPSVAIPIDGGRTLWRWTKLDIARAKRLKAKAKPGRKPKTQGGRQWKRPESVRQCTSRLKKSWKS